MDGDFQKKIIHYIKFYHDDEIIRNEDDFEEKEEFYKYMTSLIYTALNGTKDSSHNKLCTSPIVRLDFHNQGRQSKFQ
jgi:hypothetical protein